MQNLRDALEQIAYIAADGKEPPDSRLATVKDLAMEALGTSDPGMVDGVTVEDPWIAEDFCESSAWENVFPAVMIVSGVIIASVLTAALCGIAFGG